MKVYIVEYGQYSDHTYHSIHSTPERAQIVVDRLKQQGGYYYKTAEFTEHEVDSYELPVVPPGMRAYDVCVYGHGTVDVQSDDDDLLELEEKAKAGSERLYPDTSYLTWVFARDANHAAKIAQDRRAQLLAEREGLA